MIRPGPERFHLENMTVHRRALTIGVLLFVTLSVLFFSFRHRFFSQKDNIFINETSDHRFDESIMVSILAAQDRTGVQNAVVITDNWAGFGSIEEFSAHVFDRLKVGQNHKGRGLLYLFSPKSKQLKIEVSYALEGILPDTSLVLLEEAAKSYIYSDRWHDFWAELINTINIRIAGEISDQNSNWENFKYYSGGAGLAKRNYDPSSEQFLSEINRISNDPKETIEASSPTEALTIYLNSLKDGVYDPELPILHPTSRAFRVLTPMTRSQLLRNYLMMTKAGIDRIFELENLAIVFFKDETSVLPLIFLKNTKGNWQIHEGSSWSYFHRYENSNRLFLKFPLSIKDPDLRKYVQRRFQGAIFHTLPALQFPAHLITLNPLAKNWESYFFNYFWLVKVAKEIEEGQSVPLEVRLDTWTNLGRFSRFLEDYKLLHKRHPKDQIVIKNLEFYEKFLDFESGQWLKSADLTSK